MSIAVEAIRVWRNDPVRFVRDCFGAEPDEWQKEALYEYLKNRRLAMKASKGVGKSCIMSWMILHFLTCYANPKIAVTSISGQNLKDGLWSELGLWISKSPLHKEAFEFTKTRIYLKTSPETWFVSARTWAKGADPNQQANTLAGLHAENIMFVLDESGGIPDAVAAAAEAALSGGGNCKLIMSGNPTHLEGPLYRACTKERHLWALITINSDPNNPKRSPRVSIEWAREQIEKYGNDSPYVLVNVFGEFPPSSLNALLGPDIVEEAMKRKYSDKMFSYSQKRLGVDVALYGDDNTVIFPRQGLCAFKPVILKNAKPRDISARVIAAKLKWGSELEFVDCSGGFGSGVVDNMEQSGYNPIQVQFAGKPIENRFLNKRAEIWWLMKEWIEKGGCLPNIPELVSELTAATYTLKNGKFMIEPKDLIKERIGRSPDLADGLACTFALPDAPAKTKSDIILSAHTKNHNQTLHEWDPFAEA